MRTILYSFILGLAALVGCNKENNARLEVRLTDAPGDYEEVNVDIQSVEIHASDGNYSSGWMTLTDIRPGVYNLLDLTNGLDTLLGSVELPAGKVSQLRLILGNNNSIKLKGSATAEELSTPSAMQSGLKVQIHQDLEEGVTYKILLDFDAGKSIVESGGKFSLKPVIRSIVEAQSGAIKGDINPAGIASVVAVSGTTTVGTFSQENGEFVVRGVPAGIYTVTVSTTNPVRTATRTGVVVTIGQSIDLGDITLE